MSADETGDMVHVETLVAEPDPDLISPASVLVSAEAPV